MNDYLDDVIEELVPRPDGARGDWGDVLRRTHRGSRSRKPVAALLGVTLAAAAIGLAVTLSWRTGPSSLERASAAITAPSRKQVLYTRYQAKFSGCCRLLDSTNVQLWVQGASPRHWRAVTPCVGTGPLGEGGGRVGSQVVLLYAPKSDTITRITNLQLAKSAFDPVASVRQALASGHAKITGRSLIAGRPVVRIVLRARDQQGTLGTVVYYADPKTFAPVEIDYPHIVELRFPFQPIFGNGIYRETIRFTAYEYLPATPANLALTNVRREHPTARVR